VLHRLTELDLSKTSELTVARIWKIENGACQSRKDEIEQVNAVLANKDLVKK